MNCDDEMCPAEIRELANVARGAVLPEKSKPRYEYTYESFRKWQTEKKVEGLFSEDVFLAYFRELSEKVCPTTMWSAYSMLRNTVNLYHKIDIHSHAQLMSYLSANSKGYKPVKAQVFSDCDIAKFLNKADDHIWLAHKVSSVSMVIVIYFL